MSKRAVLLGEHAAKKNKKNNKSVKCLKHSAVNQKTAFSVSRHVLKVVAECEAANLTQGVVLVCW